MGPDPLKLLVFSVSWFAAPLKEGSRVSGSVELHLSDNFGVELVEVRKHDQESIVRIGDPRTVHVPVQGAQESLYPPGIWRDTMREIENPPYFARVVNSE